MDRREEERVKSNKMTREDISLEVSLDEILLYEIPRPLRENGVIILAEYNRLPMFGKRSAFWELVAGKKSLQGIKHWGTRALEPYYGDKEWLQKHKITCIMSKKELEQKEAKLLKADWLFVHKDMGEELAWPQNTVETLLKLPRFGGLLRMGGVAARNFRDYLSKTLCKNFTSSTADCWASLNTEQRISVGKREEALALLGAMSRLPFIVIMSGELSSEGGLSEEASGVLPLAAIDDKSTLPSNIISTFKPINEIIRGAENKVQAVHKLIFESGWFPGENVFLYGRLRGKAASHQRKRWY